MSWQMKLQKRPALVQMFFLHYPPKNWLSLRIRKTLQKAARICKVFVEMYPWLHCLHTPRQYKYSYKHMSYRFCWLLPPPSKESQKKRKKRRSFPISTGDYLGNSFSRPREPTWALVPPHSPLRCTPPHNSKAPHKRSCLRAKGWNPVEEEICFESFSCFMFIFRAVKQKGFRYQNLPVFVPKRNTSVHFFNSLLV